MAWPVGGDLAAVMATPLPQQPNIAVCGRDRRYRPIAITEQKGRRQRHFGQQEHVKMPPMPVTERNTAEGPEDLSNPRLHSFRQGVKMAACISTSGALNARPDSLGSDKRRGS